MKKLTAFLLLGALVVALSNCKQDNNLAANPLEGKGNLYKLGIDVLGKNCISCHAHDEAASPKVAPSLAAIKAAYLEDDHEEQGFVRSMVAFLEKPTADAAKMPKAVQKHGLMPNLSMSTDQYEAVATYLFQADVASKNWYDQQYKREVETLALEATDAPTDYLKKGQELALSTKAVLGKNLLGAIKKKGTAGALAFCNERAIHLTDSMSTQLKAEIKRVSDRNRNPNNSASAEELAYIAKAKAQIEQGAKPQPQVTEADDHVLGYYPILTNAMCLQCHGKVGDDINPDTYDLIQERYPKDLAVGYSTEQLRGIWVVKMDNTTVN